MEHKIARRLLGEDVIEEKNVVSGTTVYKADMDDISEAFRNIGKEISDRDIKLSLSSTKLDNEIITGTFNLSAKNELIFESGNVVLIIETKDVKEISIGKKVLQIFLNDGIEIHGTF